VAVDHQEPSRLPAAFCQLDELAIQFFDVLWANYRRGLSPDLDLVNPATRTLIDVVAELFAVAKESQLRYSLLKG
jgi:hypothetical protein